MTSDPLIMGKAPNWDHFQDIDEAIKLLEHAISIGWVKDSDADRIRFWTARGLAMRQGKNPMAYFLWLLKNPDAEMPCWAEDEGSPKPKRKKYKEPGGPGYPGKKADPEKISQYWTRYFFEDGDDPAGDIDDE